MTFDTSFDKVIREVEQNARVRPSFEKYLIVEKKKKEVRVLQKGSLIVSMFGGQLSHYIVGNSRDASNTAEGRLTSTVRDFYKNRSIDVIIDYEVSCPAGEEETVLYALCAGNLKPQEELERRIQTYVAEYSRLDGGRFIDSYTFEVPKLTNLIINSIQRETGLCFRARIVLDRESEVQPFVIQPTSFSVRVQDCDDALDLQLNAELIVDEKEKVRAILAFGREFELANIIKDGIREYFRKNISIQQFYSCLSTSVRNEVSNHLNGLIAEYGRKLNFLTLTSKVSESAPVRFEEIKCPVNCEIHDPELISFTINNTLQMELNDIGKYRLAQTPDLQNWSKAQLEPTIKTALFQKKYIQVLLSFDEIAESIKNQVRKAASEIGYSVEQIVSIPKLEPLAFTRDYDLEVKEESFTLKDFKVSVGLNIVATFHIPHLQDIEEYLTPSVNLKELITKNISVVARRFLNTIEPERFYMRFSDPASHLGEDKSIEDELSEKIEEILAERFKAQVSSIVIRTLETDIKRRYEKLFKKIGSFKLEFNSFKDGKPVFLSGDFQVAGVDQYGWYTFQEREAELEEIEHSIRRSLHAKLSNLPSEILTYNNVETQTRLEQLVEKVATESVVKQFGLRIEVSNVTRRLTELEKLKSDAEQAFERLRINKTATVAAAREAELDAQLKIVQASCEASVAELNKLLNQREAIIDLEDNDEELEALNEKIEGLQANIPSGSIEEAELQLKSMRLSESDTNYLVGFSRQMRLEGVEEGMDKDTKDTSDDET